MAQRGDVTGSGLLESRMERQISRRSDGHLACSGKHREAGCNAKSSIVDREIDAWLKHCLTAVYAEILEEPLPERLRSTMYELDDALLHKKAVP